MVSFLDEVEACNASNYEYFGDWRTLEREERAFLVAIYYQTVLVHGHQEDAASDEVARRAKKGKKG